jgi:hypothetical protein
MPNRKPGGNRGTRLAEVSRNPNRDSGGRCFWYRGPPVRCAWLALAGAFLLSSANAQEAVGVIEQRIERTFDLVIGNSADLAIPLTRRALARRSAATGTIDPLPYRDATAPQPALAAPTESAETPVVEQGSSEGGPTAIQDIPDADLARLPRPRPDRPGDNAEAQGDADEEPAGAAAPIDLVAGAAAPPLAQPLTTASLKPAPEVAPAEASPQPILPPAQELPVPELVANGACLTPDKVTDKDGDFQRNAEALSGSNLCIAEETFKERRRTWTLETVKSSRPGPLWAVMHDDEDMSFDNAVEALKTYGGTLVTVDTGGKRNKDGIDPNRNFSAGGIGCSKLGNDASPRFTAFFRALMSDEPIIALHNNYNGDVPTGGLGHASMETVAKDMQVSAAPDQKGPLAGPRNLVLLVSPIPVTATSQTRAAALNARGINVMIEGVRDGEGDCSLSNYALLTGHSDYLNVTVDHGERDRQRQIIDVIMAGRNDTVATQ